MRTSVRLWKTDKEGELVVDGDERAVSLAYGLDDEHSDTDAHWSAGLVVVQRSLYGVLILATSRPLSDDESNAGQPAVDHFLVEDEIMDG